MYGPPGCGKTTLAMELAKHGFGYVNLGREPDFRTVPMPDLAARCFHRSPSPRGLVVEGVLARREGRVKFIERLLALLREGDDTRFRRVCVFGLLEDAETLATRRRRSVEDYRELLETIQPDNPPYPHVVLDGRQLHGVPERAAAVLRAVESLPPA